MKHIPLGTSKYINYPVGMTNLKDTIEIVDLMKERLIELYGRDSLTFLVRGGSGAILAGILCTLFKDKPNDCRIFHVKKVGEKSHDTSSILNKNSRMIILDDFIDSGYTMKAIYKAYIEETEDMFSKIDAICVSSDVRSSCINFPVDFLICDDYVHRN